MSELDDSVYRKHKEYAAKHTFAYSEQLEGFTPKEKDILIKSGCWLNALATGLVPPITDAQKRFISVCAGVLSASTEYELVWIKYSEYKKRKELLYEKKKLEDLEFGRSLKMVSDQELVLLMSNKSLSPTRLAYVQGEWRNRFPAVEGVVHATTDGQ